MKVVLLRVGIDTGSGGIHGPLLQDGKFEFIPIPESNPDFANDGRTYGNTLGRYGKKLIEYFPYSVLRDKRRDESPHFDPEFKSFTYGDPTSLKARLRFLEQGDILAFYAGLKPWGSDDGDALYLVGYFTVQKAGRVTQKARDKAYVFTPEEVRRDFAGNAHVLNRNRFQSDKDRLVLVKGDPDKSRLLSRAVKVSSDGKDKAGKRLKVLSKEMQGIFGNFNGKISIQRSSPRWITDPSLVQRAADFLQSLK